MMLSLRVGYLAPILIWSGLNWVVVEAAYSRQNVGVFGKRLDGRMSGWHIAALLPYLAVTWLTWKLQVILTREATFNEVISGLWLGRRCTNEDLPSGIAIVVDVTSEFAEPKDVVSEHIYWCLPVLDASIPPLAKFREMVDKIAATSDPVYIHCALGHSRSAIVMIAALVAKGQAATLQDAEQLVKKARPRVKINTVQYRSLEKWIAGN